MSASELLRAEAKRRMADGNKSLVRLSSWMQAADFLDEQRGDGTAQSLDVDTLARALRAHNCRHFPENQQWEEVEERVKDLWREKARWIIDHIGGAA